MRSSVALYNAVAGDYDDRVFNGFPYKRAYDLLAWEHVCRFLPPKPGLVIDVGCGTGRWVDRLLQLGHDVIGIEQAPEMVRALKMKRYGPKFTLIPDDMEKASVQAGTADAVVAMGSLQYAQDPAGLLRRFAVWTKLGGAVCVIVDSLVSLVLELIDTGKSEEALARLGTATGVWKQRGLEADLHLLDRRTMERYFSEAGFNDVVCKGILVSGSAWGREACARAMVEDQGAFLALERALSEYPVMVDAGKQILVSGRRGRDVEVQ
jgi:SAM-dependent methyltransferase